MKIQIRLVNCIFCCLGVATLLLCSKPIYRTIAPNRYIGMKFVALFVRMPPLPCCSGTIINIDSQPCRKRNDAFYPPRCVVATTEHYRRHCRHPIILIITTWKQHFKNVPHSTRMLPFAINFVWIASCDMVRLDLYIYIYHRRTITYCWRVSPCLQQTGPVLCFSLHTYM